MNEQRILKIMVAIGTAAIAFAVLSGIVAQSRKPAHKNETYRIDTVPRVT